MSANRAFTRCSGPYMDHLANIKWPFVRSLRAWLAMPLIALTLFIATGDWWHVHAREDAADAGHERGVPHWKGGELGFAQAGLLLPQPGLSPALPPVADRELAPDSAGFIPGSARDPPLV